LRALHSATCRARKAQPVSNERPDAVAAGCSGGRRRAAGPDAPLAARRFAGLVRRGAEASVPGEGPSEKKSVVRPISYLGVSSPCVSSVPHGPPRARPPSLSGFDPPRGRPSSVGHSAPLITADLRSELPAACGGLSAVQRPQPHVLVSGRQFAFSLFLTHFPHESRACTARQVPAARAWVANQVKNGRSAPMRSMLPESRRHGQRQWPRWSARMSWEHALAWACRLAAGAIDRRGERQP